MSRYGKHNTALQTIGMSFYNMPYESLLVSKKQDSIFVDIFLSICTHGSSSLFLLLSLFSSLYLVLILYLTFTKSFFFFSLQRGYLQKQKTKMVAVDAGEVQTQFELKYDRASEIKAFDEMKTGVKGLVDSGISEVPRIFHQPPDIVGESYVPSATQFSIPVIDLQGVKEDPSTHTEIVKQVLNASQEWGFFQIINHGIPLSVLEEMKVRVRRFYELDNELKKQFYTRDTSKKVVYNCNFDLHTAPAANWRDTVYFDIAPDPPKPEELPEPFRDMMVEYTDRMMNLGRLLFELISEALGLNPDHLVKIDCAKGLGHLCHYYPACPQPELTIGTSKHTDSYFLTVLLQDHIGGLQVLYENQWIDVPPVPEALVVNIGDLLQLISNDRLVSVEHRVLANSIGPRVSVASFFIRETTVVEYMSHFQQKGLDGKSALLHFKI
ncbi:hypothetical protein ES288_A02G045600v1 [Gossypium darwinii]|uniref:Fe2OG dioxygenase domain-containing protein n=1 Tax=Gossypium darwinii TaxID=34276 RepID=A0A5D2HC43_GOSDA|nr:hypothetical protein ES288_A02G045600v1 [Gossypium darwinii]